MKRLDEKIAEVEERWEHEHPVPSEEEEEELEQLWQLKKLEAKVWELGQRVLDLQRKLKGIQMEVDILQSSTVAQRTVPMFGRFAKIILCNNIQLIS